MAQQTHELKILPKFLFAIEQGIKAFELRINDRNYTVGDILILKEFCDGEYSGRSITRQITYILRAAETTGLQDTYVIMGIQ